MGITETSQIPFREHKCGLGATAELPTLSADPVLLARLLSRCMGDRRGGGALYRRTLTMPSDRPDISPQSRRHSAEGMEAKPAIDQRVRASSAASLALPLPWPG